MGRVCFPVGPLTLQRAEVTVHGQVSVGANTKILLRSIEPHRIAVISHEDLDEMAAQSLIEAQVKAVINAAPTISGHYPLYGPALLLQSGIPILEISERDFEYFDNGMDVWIHNFSYIELADRSIAATPLTLEHCVNMNRLAQQNFGELLNDFIDNTLFYALQDKDSITSPLHTPPLKTSFMNRHVVVVVRGQGYKNDLYSLQSYIDEVKPALIGVDGGADALLEQGYKPDIIIGDMDSVSDEALRCGAEIVVHAYGDGRAPGMTRVASLGLEAGTIRAKGISEDVALLLAYEKCAELIIIVGSHTCMYDFLAKGRKGMGSSLLVRMKVGAKLIDAKGFSKLFNTAARRIQLS